MRSHQVRIVTACQQLLALGVVLAMLTPAAAVITLDVVGTPDEPRAAAAEAQGAALVAATVPKKVVEPAVREVALTGGANGRQALSARVSAAGATVTSRVEPVAGLGTVGVTWDPGAEIPEGGVVVEVRTRSGEEWSGWEALEYHDHEGPDPQSAEGRGARPGTDPMLVGDVDDVQVRVRRGLGGPTLPAGLRLAVVDPGISAKDAVEMPADQSDTDGEQDPTSRYDDSYEQGTGEGIRLQSAPVARAAGSSAKVATAPQPPIFSRAQWGADERMRDASALRYGSVAGGFVHHTVNANDYGEADVPAIIRSIYAYHTKSRGWSDIGYNFLVDRFGRIWEGRYGGIDKPVVGAHTLGYNDYSFAMSAIGNFEEVQPPDVMLRAYGALFAWRLSLAGVDPSSPAQRIGKGTFAAISGHRDAGQTACPGRYLYAQIPLIRQYAAASLAPPPPPVERVLQSNLAGSPHPDLVVRRAVDGQGFIVPTGGLAAFSKPVVSAKRGWAKRAELFVSPDLTGDGRPDLVSTSAKGTLQIRPGKGYRFGKVTKTVKAFRGHGLVAAVGDVNKDGRGDLVSREKGRLVVWLGAPKGGFREKPLDKGYGGTVELIGAGDVTSDGRPDLLSRDGKGRVWLRAGIGRGRFAAKQQVAGSFSAYTDVIGGADYTGDGRPDLLLRAKSGQIFARAGHGDGTFGPRQGPLRNLKSMDTVSGFGQLVGSGAADLVTRKGDTLYVVPNRGTFDLGAPIDTGQSFAGANLLVNVGDFDRDGAGDVVARDAEGRLLLHRGNGLGQLAPPTVIGTGFGGYTVMAAGDANGDGFPDLLAQAPGGPMQLFPGTGVGLGTPYAVGTVTTARPVVAGASGKALTGAMPQTLQRKLDLSGYDWVVQVSSMQLAGASDLLVRQAATGYLYFINLTAGGGSAPRLLGEGLGAFDLAG